MSAEDLLIDYCGTYVELTGMSSDGFKRLVEFAEAYHKSKVEEAIKEIESRKRNIIENGSKMPQPMQEGGVMAFESSLDVLKELLKQ